MKNIKKHFHAIVLLLGLLISTNACEDLAFGCHNRHGLFYC